MPTLAKIKDCTGCAACVNSCPHDAIVMTEGVDKFLYPKINTKKCVECRLCEKSCPVITPLKNENEKRPRAYAAWNNYDRRRSSSGGAFSSFARMTLSHDGIVFGAAFDENLYCHHIEINDIKDLDLLRGAKYIQSSIGYIFRKVLMYLKNGTEVLFCGTPCQVAGLKTFLRKDYNNLITLDLVCHGVPSNALFQAYKNKLQNSSTINGKINGFVFRKKDGWGKCSAIFVADKLSNLYGGDNLYMDAFDKCAIFRECCYKCQYTTTKRIGDCSLGDFWGIGRHGIPFKHSVVKGVSLILVNNEKGEKTIKCLQNTFLEERTLDEALIENHNLKKSSVAHPERKSIISAFFDNDKSLKEIDSEFHLIDYGLKAIIKQLASKLHLLDLSKWFYNIYKVNKA